MIAEWKLDADAITEFRSWLRLNLTNIVWGGKNQASFEIFWESLFRIDEGPTQVHGRFDLVKKLTKTGPLNSWLGWLDEKFLIYAFYRSDLSIKDFCLSLGIAESWFAFIMRSHLLLIAPLKEDKINDLMNVGNLLSPARDNNWTALSRELGLTGFPAIDGDEDMMLSLEVTLFPQWPMVVKELKKDLYDLRMDFEKLTKRMDFRRQTKFIQEVLLLLLIGGAAIWALKVGNRWYEDYLVGKIKLLEPAFFGLDQTLSYQAEDQARRTIELSQKEIENLEKVESAKVFEDAPGTVRFDPESDEVVLTSVENIPKTLNSAESEASEFEEKNKGGYRDSSAAGGGRKAYRVLMSSTDPNGIKNQLLPLLKAFKVSQVDNVKPGQEIPGGVYFNLLVPSSELKDFLGKVTALEDASIFESSARDAVPAGKNKVFIWVKAI